MLSRRALCLIGSFASALPAQTTHLVGPGALPEIRDALAIASPGDVILVQSGTYAHFTANVAVTIRAVTTGTVAVTWQSQYVSPACLIDPTCLGGLGATVFAAPAGEAVHVVGIDFLPNTFLGIVPVRHYVAVTSGAATFDQCSIQANSSTALWVLQASVHLQDCAVTGTGLVSTGHGVVLADSTLTAIDSAIAGNSGLLFPGFGIIAINSTVQGSNLQVFGGTAAIGGTGASAVLSDPASKVWVSDSMLVATNQCAVITNGATGRIERTTQLGSTGCNSLPAGTMLGVDRPTPAAGGSSFTLRYHCDPNALVAIFCSAGLHVVPLPGLTEQPVSLSLANFFSGGVYLTDSTGTLSVTWQMPGGAPFVNQPLWFQAVGGLAFPLQVTPIAGGIVR